MKSKILALGKVLDKNQQKNVTGGIDARPVGFTVRCYLGGQCIRYGKMCKEPACWYSPA